MLQLEGVKKSYNGRCIIESASFCAQAGEIICLTGPSGVGKSTLLEIMAGVITPDYGKITRKAPVALAFQDDALIPWLNAMDNIRYALSAQPEMASGHTTVAVCLALFGLQGDVYPGAMSGGMRRRLNIARSFSVKRPLLLLDEPFAFLDSHWQSVIAGEISMYALQGNCVILASHSLEPLKAIPHRQISIDRLPIRL